MKRLNLMLIPCSSANDFYRKFRKRMVLQSVLEGVKLVFLVGLALFFLLDYFSPLAQTSSRIDLPDQENEVKVLSYPKAIPESNVQEVLHLSNMIRLITDDQIPENKGLRYAGLIYHACQKYAVNPLEIIAIIMAESNFQEKSVNTKTGDYGLGQINWVHWGKPNGLLPQELLDPSINIFLTCLVYKYFGEDFGRYHRGNGIKSQAYIVNIRSIVSTLSAFAELNKKNPSQSPTSF